jgi:streptogramin lyase
MRYRRLLVALLVSIACGCSMNSLAPGGSTNVGPQVVQKGGGSTWVTLTPHTAGALGAGIVAGPDGNMWYIDENAFELVRLSMSGAFKEFSIAGVLGSNPIALTVGADGKFYVANESSKIVRVTTGGVAVAFSIPSGDNTELGTIALGPDGNVWFPETAHLGTITPAGAITEFAYPAGFAVPNQLGTVATGADGNIWFGETSDDAVVRFTLATHKFKEFKLASECEPVGLVKAKDDNIWFGCIANAPQIGRITKAGNIRLFPGGGSFSGEETFQISTIGADGEPWFSGGTNDIFRINTANGSVSSFSPPFLSGERPDSVALGPDGNIWVTTVGLDNVYVFIPSPITLTPDKITLSGAGQSKKFTVAETGTANWTASSSNTAVATVAQSSPANTFKVTAVATGKCKIKVTDALGNSANVSVTVN